MRFSTRQSERRQASKSGVRLRMSCLLALAGLGGAAAPVSAGPPTLLLDDEMAERRVQVVSINDREISFDDERGLRRTLPLQRVLAVIDDRSGELGVLLPNEVDDSLPQVEELDRRRILRQRGGEVDLDQLRSALETPEPASAEVLERGWVLELTDGQRWFGEPTAGPGAVRSADTLWWTLRDGRVRRVPLEQVDRFGRLPPFGGPTLPRPDNSGGGADDLVRLTNGDVLRGFVLAAGDRVVIEVGPSEVAAAIGRVLLVDLGTAAAAPTGPRLWLEDGSVLAPEVLIWSSVPGLAGLEIAEPGGAGSGSESALDAGPPPLPLASIAAIVPEASRLVAISSLGDPESRVVGERFWAQPVRSGDGAARTVGAGVVEMPGPMEALWVLPREADGFAASISLPAELRDLGDFEFSVLVSQPFAEPELLSTVRVRGAEPTVRVVVDLPGAGVPGRELVLRLDAGAGGSVQDHAVLERALLRLEPG